MEQQRGNAADQILVVVELDHVARGVAYDDVDNGVGLGKGLIADQHHVVVAAAPSMWSPSKP